jgi:hypothetical protein
MLHLDCPVPHLARLALRTHDRVARSFGERLKHTQKVLSRLASRPVQVRPVDVTRVPTTSLTETAGIHEARAASAGPEPSSETAGSGWEDQSARPSPTRKRIPDPPSLGDGDRDR